ncbi:hypothetical protein K8089_15980 [Aequorivita sp. F47161]|uniref:SMODS and SLOG-associating 2TM effector domain-containing protein n=1 Tax=Aequorivita vitellina TaxID=2874475 RepID=A0A9X1QVS9_9FLAO|nr:hypothetical protein [Aequorivita vitellina]MCG2420521.1 hypothetical protein [Aequorivita vitellina]
MEKQLLKQLYTTTSKLVNEQIKRDIENFEKADKIIIWLVGFSIGIFVLIFTRNTDNLIINQNVFEISIISLVTVILGLLFRIISFFTQMTLSSIVFDLIAYAAGFSEIKKLPTPREIEQNDTINDIIFYLKEDFGIERELIDITGFSKEKIKEYRDLQKNYYQTLASWNNTDEQLSEYREELAIRFGHNPKVNKTALEEKESSKSKGKKYKLLLKSSYILFFLTIISFIFGIGFLAFKLIESNYS